MKFYDYEGDLLRPEWESKRNSILDRDNHQCVRCGKKEYEKGFYTTLNVHHLKYIPNRRLWEYDDNDLITLCRNCHKKEHGLIQVNRNHDTLQIDWKKHNSKLLSEDLIPHPFTINIKGVFTENHFEYLRKSYSNYYYVGTLLNYIPNNHLKEKFVINGIGYRYFFFHKESIFTFLKIHNAISCGNYKVTQEKYPEDISIGLNNERFIPMTLWGRWISINTSFNFYETNNNDEILKEIRREVNNYVLEPKISNSFNFFLEPHHFNDLEYIVENKIAERIPFMVEQ